MFLDAYVQLMGRLGKQEAGYIARFGADMILKSELAHFKLLRAIDEKIRECLVEITRIQAINQLQCLKEAAEKFDRRLTEEGTSYLEKYGVNRDVHKLCFSRIADTYRLRCLYIDPNITATEKKKILEVLYDRGIANRRG